MSQLTYNLLGLLYHLPINNPKTLAQLHRLRLWFRGYRWRCIDTVWADDPYTLNLQIEELVRLSVSRYYIRTRPHRPGSLLLYLEVWCDEAEHDYLVSR